MSNDSKNVNANENSESGKNQINRSKDAAHKTDQQSQDAVRHQNDKSHQHGATDRKSGQQSEGGTNKDNSGMRQSGSGHATNDQKQPTDKGHKGAQSR
jgi:hypothetical protein